VSAVDPDKFRRSNRWMGQIAETVSALKEVVMEEHGAHELLDHHVRLLKDVRDESRLPDSFEQVIDELLELIEEITG
jgi:hypothetical protein